MSVSKLIDDTIARGGWSHTALPVTPELPHAQAISEDEIAAEIAAYWAGR